MRTKIDVNKLEVADFPKTTKLVVRHITSRAALAEMPTASFGVPRYATIADVIDRTSGVVLARGVSKCGPFDQPSRKLGFVIAVNRAAKAYYSGRSRVNGWFLAEEKPNFTFDWNSAKAVAG